MSDIGDRAESYRIEGAVIPALSTPNLLAKITLSASGSSPETAPPTRKKLIPPPPTRPNPERPQLIFPSFFDGDLLPNRRRQRIARISNLNAINQQTMAFSNATKVKPHILEILQDGRPFYEGEAWPQNRGFDLMNSLLEAYMRSPWHVEDLADKYHFNDGINIDPEHEAVRFHREVADLTIAGTILKVSADTFIVRPIVIKDDYRLAR